MIFLPPSLVSLLSRYANQDEEDLELAMQALGHRRPGGGGVGTLSEKQEEENQLKKSKEKQLKQEKVPHDSRSSDSSHTPPFPSSLTGWGTSPEGRLVEIS
jgi:hypothetical protein